MSIVQKMVAIEQKAIHRIITSEHDHHDTRNNNNNTNNCTRMTCHTRQEQTETTAMIVFQSNSIHAFINLWDWLYALFWILCALLPAHEMELISYLLLFFVCDVLCMVLMMDGMQEFPINQKYVK